MAGRVRAVPAVERKATNRASGGQERHGQGIHGRECEGKPGLLVQHGVDRVEWIGRVENFREKEAGPRVGILSA